MKEQIAIKESAFSTTEVGEFRQFYRMQAALTSDSSPVRPSPAQSSRSSTSQSDGGPADQLTRRCTACTFQTFKTQVCMSS